MRKSGIFTALASLLLAACGGGGNSGSSSFAGSTGGGTTNNSVASIVLISSAATIPSDNSLSAELTAFVRDSNNNFLANIPVIFQTSSGGLTPAATATDANGAVKATLNAFDDKRNRTITVTASTGSVNATATVNVVGTTLAVQGATSLTIGQQSQPYTVTLTDAGAHGIAGVALTVQAPSNATVSTTSLTTDNQGRATFTATATAGGTGTINVTGMGLTSGITITVNSDALTFLAPAANAQIALNTAQTATVSWIQSNAAVVGQPVNFATTRGCINPAGTTCVGQSTTATVNTNGSGQASVTILSDNAGGATVTATVAGGTQAGLSVQFIATTPATIDVQPSVFTVAPNEQATISAVVRDAQNNLVANRTVVFNLNDITNGTLSTPSAVTDLQGRAQTVYTASNVASATGGVHITASVQGYPGVTPKTVNLTVGSRQVFISIGTGNQIEEPNSAQYKKDYIVQVTDANGAGVSGVPLSMSVLSIRYFKGQRQFSAQSWRSCYTIPQNLAACIIGTPPSATVTMGCVDEDFNRNGVLDAGEDQNTSGRIEAGNIAAVAPSAATTDANGFAVISIYYPQEYAYWLQVTLQAQASVQGTAFAASQTFLLEGLASDFNQQTTAPPGFNSPFGQSATCSDTL